MDNDTVKLAPKSTIKLRVFPWVQPRRAWPAALLVQHTKETLPGSRHSMALSDTPWADSGQG